MPYFIPNLLTSILTAGLAVVALPQQAVFSDFSPQGIGYNCCGGIGIGYGAATGTAGYQIATPFVASYSATFDNVSVALVRDLSGAGNNDFSILLATDNGGYPGTVLEAFQFTASILTAPPSVITANSSLHPVLQAGSRYWVLIAASDPVHAKIGWLYNSTGVPPTNMARVAGGSWGAAGGEALPAFSIGGTPVSSGSLQLICRPVDPSGGYGSYAPIIARHCYFLATGMTGEQHTYGAYDVNGKLTPLKDTQSDLPQGKPKIPNGCTGPVLGSDCIQVPVLPGLGQTYAGLVQGLENAVSAGTQGNYDRTNNNSNGWAQSQISQLHMAVTLPAHTISSQADLCSELLSGYLTGALASYHVRFADQVILFYYGLAKCGF